MLYFSNPTSHPECHQAMREGRLGFIRTPSQGNRRPEGATWIADNGCFGKHPFDPDVWWKWLSKHAPDADTCLFATAPDVVGDAAATLELATPWLPKIRDLGYRAAYVAQDGIEATVVPWDDFDVLFIGGSNHFKLGPVAHALIGEAKRAGKWVHCGRVNSLKRYRWAESIGCDSVDGTHIVFGPSINLPQIMAWMQDLTDRPALFSLMHTGETSS